jgi:type II secretory pathway pseudopilin PulG
MIYLKNSRGFTLIELLLYTVIAAGLLLSITAMIALLTQSRIKNQTISLVEQQGVQILQIISQEIRNSAAIISPANGTDSTTLQLQNASGQNIIFNLSNSTLQETKLGQTISISANNLILSDLHFINLTPDNTHNSVKIKFTLSYNNIAGRNEYNYSQTFYDTATLRKP